MLNEVKKEPGCCICLQNKFTQDMQPHYIYSPREMTRWVRGICEAIRPLETLSVEGLVRLWAHEALRLFQDRSVLCLDLLWLPSVFILPLLVLERVAKTRLNVVVF